MSSWSFSTWMKKVFVGQVKEERVCISSLIWWCSLHTTKACDLKASGMILQSSNRLEPSAPRVIFKATFFHLPLTLINTWWLPSLAFCGGTGATPSSAADFVHASLTRRSPDGRETDLSLLVRSVTSTAGPGGVSVPAPCQGSWTCQLLHLRRATAADAPHLQVNVFFEGVRVLLSEASLLSN